jgi:Putative capsular polysaccharide synthesis protein
MAFDLGREARRLGHGLGAAWQWHDARHAGKEIVLIYQMGKVGSHSILEALARAAPQRLALYHVHFLMPDQIEYWWGEAERAFGGARRVPASIYRSVANAQLLSAQVRHAVARRAPARRIKIISLTREPVAWSVSAFFTMRAWWPPRLAARCDSRSPLRPDADLVAAVRDAFFHAFRFHDLPSTWFDTDLNALLNVDVFANRFPHDPGYEVFRAPAADVLLMRTEDLARSARSALREFLNVDIGALPRVNDTGDHSYAALYSALRESLDAPPAYLDRMYESTYARHFYTDAERLRFRARWAGQAGAVHVRT